MPITTNQILPESYKAWSSLFYIQGLFINILAFLRWETFLSRTTLYIPTKGLFNWQEYHFVMKFQNMPTQYLKLKACFHFKLISLSTFSKSANVKKPKPNQKKPQLSRELSCANWGCKDYADNSTKLRVNPRTLKTPQY